MKLNDIRPTVETTGQMVEQLFSIQDTGMIFDILRNRMYSDPIRAICREITSNARDAHREVGKEDVPCEITLPTTWDRFYRVKDFGPGISPERMATVFIRYTASTKRDDNRQTGGFGLGAKTPFSYSDTFTIETIVDGIKYDYACFIDETKVGKLSLLKSETSSQPNGTEIIIPVKSLDFEKFASDTEFVTRHWDVRPIIKGRSLNYENFTPTLEGNGYKICKSSNYNVLREVKLIVDGIEYPLDVDQLKGKIYRNILDIVNGVIYLYFDVGELELSATRETVHLNPHTEAKINDKFSEILNDFKLSIENKIQACTSFWEANCYFNIDLKQTFSDTSFLSSMTWNGLPLIKGEVKLTDAKMYVFAKGRASSRRVNPDKIDRYVQTYLNFVRDAEFYLCDLAIKEPQVKDVKKAFEANPKLKYVFVIKPTDDCKDTSKIFDPYSLQNFAVKQLSSITKLSRTYNISGVRLLIFKFDPISSSFRQVSYSFMEEDTNKKVICSLDRNNYNSIRNVTLKNNKNIGNDIVKSLVSFKSGHSIYGVDTVIPNSKLEEHFSDFMPMDDFIEDVFASQNLDLCKIKYAMGVQYNLDRHAETLKELIPKIKDPGSIFIQYIDLNCDLKKIIEDNQGILNIYENVKSPISHADIDAYIAAHPELDFKKLKEKLEETYPLLKHVDYYRSYHNYDEPIIHYINLVDKELKS